ncbi:unnamed protein product, partial [Prunus brigantina]
MDSLRLDSLKFIRSPLAAFVPAENPNPLPRLQPHPYSPTHISSSPTPVPTFPYLDYSIQLAQLLGPNTTEAVTFICSQFAVVYSKISDTAYAIDLYSQCSSTSPCSA